MYYTQPLPFMTATANTAILHTATTAVPAISGIDITIIITVLTLATILVIVLLDKTQTIYVIKILREVLQRAQTPPPVQRQPPPPSPPPLPKPITSQPITPSPLPPPPPKPQGPFADAPKWFQLALNEIGFHETGNNQGLDRYIAMAHTGENGEPWCAIFANAMLESSGVRGTRSPASQSFKTSHDFDPLSGPALGCIVVFWRGAKTSGLGHVGFYRGENATHIWTLGGNEQDMVQIEALEKSSPSFGLVGYYWPKSVPMPKVGPILMPSGSPTSIKTPQMPIPSAPSPAGGRQMNIIATFEQKQESAYGGMVNDSEYGVALPYRFTGERPRVRVTNPKTGASVDCSIVDIGPWNINDPYWTTGSRPQAESGRDKWKGRKTNGAGIDLTLAAAQALQIDGKGLVNWEFIT